MSERRSTPVPWDGVTTVAAVHGVLPPHRYPQAELTELFGDLCLPEARTRAVAERLHGNAGVATRHLALPIERYAELDTFTAANDAFIDVAVDLGVRGGRRRAGRGRARSPTDVDLIMSTTVTGVAVPSLDARIAGRIGLRPDVKRVPMFGLGLRGRRGRHLPACTTSCSGTPTTSPCWSRSNCAR